MMKSMLAILMCLMCLVCSAAAEGNAPCLPDIAAFADGRLSETTSKMDEKTHMIYFTGARQDVKYVVNGYFDLLENRYNLVEDAHFDVEYAHDGVDYDYYVYCFSYSGPDGDTIANMHMATSRWEVSGSDVVICYSQGRPGNENVHFGFSNGFNYADAGERLDVDAVIAAADTLPLPDIGVYSAGLLSLASEEYVEGGVIKLLYTGETAAVTKAMQGYIELLANSYSLEQTDRVEWEHGHKHITCAFQFTGEGADGLRTMDKKDEEAGMDIRDANLCLAYIQGEDGMDTLELEFFDQDFSVKDAGDRPAK